MQNSKKDSRLTGLWKIYMIGYNIQINPIMEELIRHYLRPYNSKCIHLTTCCILK